MGYSIQAKTMSGKEVDYFHYPSKDLFRPLHKALGVVLKDNTPISKSYPLGCLLEAKSKLVDTPNVSGENDFLDRCIMEAKESRKPIYITFN